MVTRTKKIFVGGLSAPTTLEDVKSYFEQFGTVSTKIFALNPSKFNFRIQIQTQNLLKLFPPPNPPPLKTRRKLEMRKKEEEEVKKLLSVHKTRQ
jgi:RNA recognition motif-containing protein